MRRYASSTRSYLFINTLFHLMAVQIQLWKVTCNSREHSVNSSFLYRPQILDLDKACKSLFSLSFLYRPQILDLAKACKPLFSLSFLYRPQILDLDKACKPLFSLSFLYRPQILDLAKACKPLFSLSFLYRPQILDLDKACKRLFSSPQIEKSSLGHFSYYQPHDVIPLSQFLSFSPLLFLFLRVP
ncbi:hypothetical protein PoB_002759900 [Plakobranchus ocellatus]|uniref:Uncharacterized protein n=1 Tax=Plakobranchus ocellatus TaxID=259542 RepID=A0AAV4A4E6_9GAST|nr:hypothetical protein PoB_002759900 [Plakobranchus ocellatus]